MGYRLAVEDVAGDVSAARGGETLFRASGVKLMRETRLPDCPYFPPEALAGLNLSRSDLRTFCPFKGTATYWNAVIGGERIPNAVWSYERALPSSAAIEGMMALMPALGVDFTFEAAPAPSDDGHVMGPLVDWITRDAGAIPDGAALTKRLAERMRADGIAVARMSVLLWSLHPEQAGVNYVWRWTEPEVMVRRPSFDILLHPDFLNSPLRLVTDGLGGVRQPLQVETPEFPFSIFEDLRAEGMTDYVAMPLFFSDGRINVLTLASDHPDGFTTENLGMIFECSSAIARYYEVQTLRANAQALLETYVGRRAGARVMGGEIRRGDGDDIEAAILFCDLIGSTRLQEELGRDAYLTLLNGFFEAVTAAVWAEGGEVLKFIGDAVLAVFPVEAGAVDARRRAARAAAAAPKALDEAGLSTPVAVATGVSFGPVTYGNVGAPDRLDFTVIGKAATLAARLSDLAKAEGRGIVFSADVAKALGGAARPIGARRLHNIAAPVEVAEPVERP